MTLPRSVTFKEVGQCAIFLESFESSNEALKQTKMINVGDNIIIPLLSQQDIQRISQFVLTKPEKNSNYYAEYSFISLDDSSTVCIFTPILTYDYKQGTYKRCWVSSPIDDQKNLPRDIDYPEHHQVCYELGEVTPPSPQLAVALFHFRHVNKHITQQDFEANKDLLNTLGKPFIQYGSPQEFHYESLDALWDFLTDPYNDKTLFHRLRKKAYNTMHALAAMEEEIAPPPNMPWQTHDSHINVDIEMHDTADASLAGYIEYITNQLSEAFNVDIDF